ncbi:MAG: 2-oxo acid dehydrogenase subunit E2 [Oscillospiraceae bacterium]|nr:2-oxo acid dehydrogenase subunit E2 [Oscillospiraceae bacterium]
MADLGYSKRSGDRREGRRIRGMNPYRDVMPYFIRRRSSALCTLSDSVEVSAIEHWLLEKRAEGWAGLGFIHLLVAAYVRTVSMRPAINRFISARHIYARNGIQVVLTVKRSASSNATETCVKVGFSPTDTVFDVYRRLSEAVDSVKADVIVSEPEHIASSLIRLPRPFLRVVTAVLRLLDYFDWLPRGWLDESPFHGSLSIVDMGSLGVMPVEAALPDFGNIPCAVSFGAKRKVRELDENDQVTERHYVDYRVSCDARIADGYYFASALKCLKYFMKNPAHLELPPETIEDDIN